jgi:hypothetical protein
MSMNPIQNPTLYYQNNVAGTAVLLDVMRDGGVGGGGLGIHQLLLPPPPPIVAMATNVETDYTPKGLGQLLPVTRVVTKIRALRS